jgi:hypothetical protein
MDSTLLMFNTGFICLKRSRCNRSNTHLLRSCIHLTQNNTCLPLRRKKRCWWKMLLQGNHSLHQTRSCFRSTYRSCMPRAKVRGITLYLRFVGNTHGSESGERDNACAVVCERYPYPNQSQDRDQHSCKHAGSSSSSTRHSPFRVRPAILCSNGQARVKNLSGRRNWGAHERPFRVESRSLAADSARA